jgi:ribosomal subunit interface protein
MDVTITGRGAGIPDRFEEYVEEKADKVALLAPRALALEVKLCRHHETNGSSGDDRIELTLIGPGPIVRAEAGAGDKYSAFDIAYDKLVERIRQAKDRKKVHRGLHRPTSLREAAADGFSQVAVAAAPAHVIEKVATGSIPVAEEEGEEDWSPVVIREKEFPAELMTAEDAVDRMELVGHDFFLFIDARTDKPSVVYRRKGWDYGVIKLDTEVAALAAR